MNEELAQLDADLKGLFSENKIEEMNTLLGEQEEATIKELMDSYWNAIKKYYDTERFDLLFQHFRFVAFSCYIIEYAHQISLVSEEAFQIMMMIFNDIYELKKKQNL